VTIFARNFDAFACMGDSITTQAEQGLYFVATLQPDADSDPHEFDAPGWVFDTAGDAEHSAAVAVTVAENRRILDAWDRDEWHYCGIVITAWVTTPLADFRLGDVGSLWGLELNFPNGESNPNAHLREQANEMLEEAHTRALELLAAIRAA
jgi:hypothetical protein